MSQSVVKIDPEIMSGAPCFAGTRVPIQNLIDYLEGGDSIEDFLEGFPSVSREQVIAFLEEAKECLLAAATRSEEHTSELQSQSNLVCRLLLEKKKQTTFNIHLRAQA